MNLFHWYSTNLINFAKCCGLVLFLNEKSVLPEQLASNQKLRTELIRMQNEYINGISELGPVKHFRDKAGAHLAYTDPFKNDNSATLIESISLCPIYQEGRMVIGGLTRSRGEHTSSFSKYPWSVTENFESLIPRYFQQYYV
jgi:hypothetical protein